MLFNSYIDARMFFQRNKNFLTEEKLLQMIEGLKELRGKEEFLVQKIHINDLIIDAEHQIDLINNPELLLHIQKEERKEKERRAKSNPYHPLTPQESIKPKELKLKESINNKYKDKPFILIINNISDEINLLSKIEKEAVKQVRELAGNNKTKMAKVLGISIKGTYDKIKRYFSK